MESELKERLTNWVNEVFKNDSFEKLHIEFPDYDSRGGSVGEIEFVDVIAEKNGRKKTLNLIIKRSKDSSVVQDTLSIKYQYSNENNVYSKFVPYLNNFAKEKNVAPFENIPHCYGTIVNENLYVIIIENLKPKGFKVHEIETPQDLSHAKLVLEAYAKWHALSFALKDQQPKIFEEFGKCNTGFQDSKIFGFVVTTIQKEIDYAIDIYKKKNILHVIEKLEVLREKHGEYLRNCCLNIDEDYLVLRHGDCWNNNFLFHYNDGGLTPDEVVVIDWQLCVLASPLVDVTNYLFSCCTRKELEHLDDLLQLYYDTLSKRLRELGSDPAKCYPWEVLLKSFKRYAPIGIATVPMFAKASCVIRPETKYDIAQAEEEGDFTSIFGNNMRDPDAYFDRVDGILELCIERGFL